MCLPLSLDGNFEVNNFLVKMLADNILIFSYHGVLRDEFLDGSVLSLGGSPRWRHFSDFVAKLGLEAYLYCFKSQSFVIYR